jgi:hypothetical protein
MTQETSPWKAQPGPQQAFVDSKIDDVVYGGARGGGKTDGVLGEFGLHAAKYGADARGLLVRRTQIALAPTVLRAQEIYGAGARWLESKSRFEWPNGAVLFVRYLENDADANGYQGHSYTRVYVEELTQFPHPAPVNKLRATLRSAAGVPCYFRATCNPGGPGHNWVKARYIDPGAYAVTVEDFVDPFDGTTKTAGRLFIPARLSDNPKLLKNDPGYVTRLMQSGSAELIKAWLDGDWNIIEGAFFDKWSVKNIVRPFKIPERWTRFRAFDWGFASPFSVGWWAVASGEWRAENGAGAEIKIRKNALVRYREWYGLGTDSKGARLPAEAIAAGILAREGPPGLREEIADSVADPSIRAQDGGPSICERLADAGCNFRPADNTRLSGWDQLRARIAGDEFGPMLFVFDTCRDFIRTVPVLQHDPIKAEDLDTRAEDHIADETRYACLSRLLAAPSPGGHWGAERSIIDDYEDDWMTV